MQLNELLRQKRNQSGLSQNALAKKLGFTSPQYVSNFERGLCLPPPSSFKALSKAIGIEVEALIEGATMNYRENLLKKIGIKKPT